jgi:3-dehydroquinate synthase
MRGVTVNLVPTTLLAMVDASLGGKTGVDFQQVKNIIGTFHPADHVYIDTSMLSHLSDREFKNGLAELIKHGFLQGGELPGALKRNTQAVLSRDPQILEKIIFDSLEVKRDYIEADPQERSGIRAQLNLGHTFAHALETLTGLSGFSHGEAVAWGMARACEAGVMLGITEPSYAQEVKNLLRSYGFEIDWKVDDDDVSSYLSNLSKDKKKQAGQVRFILQRAAGDTVMRKLPEDVIVSVISSSRRL